MDLEIRLRRAILAGEVHELRASIHELVANPLLSLDLRQDLVKKRVLDDHKVLRALYYSPHLLLDPVLELIEKLGLELPETHPGSMMILDWTGPHLMTLHGGLFQSPTFITPRFFLHQMLVGTQETSIPNPQEGGTNQGLEHLWEELKLRPGQPPPKPLLGRMERVEEFIWQKRSLLGQSWECWLLPDLGPSDLLLKFNEELVDLLLKICASSSRLQSWMLEGTVTEGRMLRKMIRVARYRASELLSRLPERSGQGMMEEILDHALPPDPAELESLAWLALRPNLCRAIMPYLQAHADHLPPGSLPKPLEQWWHFLMRPRHDRVLDLLTAEGLDWSGLKFSDPAEQGMELLLHLGCHEEFEAFWLEHFREDWGRYLSFVCLPRVHESGYSRYPWLLAEMRRSGLFSRENLQLLYFEHRHPPAALAEFARAVPDLLLGNDLAISPRDCDEIRKMRENGERGGDPDQLRLTLSARLQHSWGLVACRATPWLPIIEKLGVLILGPPPSPSDVPGSSGMGAWGQQAGLHQPLRGAKLLSQALPIKRHLNNRLLEDFSLEEGLIGEAPLRGIILENLRRRHEAQELPFHTLASWWMNSLHPPNLGALADQRRREWGTLVLNFLVCSSGTFARPGHLWNFLWLVHQDISLFTGEEDEPVSLGDAKITASSLDLPLEALEVLTQRGKVLRMLLRHARSPESRINPRPLISLLDLGRATVYAFDGEYPFFGGGSSSRPAGTLLEISRFQEEWRGVQRENAAAQQLFVLWELALAGYLACCPDPARFCPRLIGAVARFLDLGIGLPLEIRMRIARLSYGSRELFFFVGQLLPVYAELCECKALQKNHPSSLFLSLTKEEVVWRGNPPEGPLSFPA